MAHVGNRRKAKNTNLSLVRIFGLCVGTLVFFYSVLAVRQFLVRESFDATFRGAELQRAWPSGLARSLSSPIRPGSRDRLERQVDGDGARLRGGVRQHQGQAQADRAGDDGEPAARAGDDPLAGVGVSRCFRSSRISRCSRASSGLGAGYAVADKRPCAPALVLPMLALFVGVITLLRYDIGGDEQPVLDAADERADLGAARDGRVQLADVASGERAALSAARHELRPLRLHLLSGRPALRQTAAQRQCAQSLRPQSARQHRSASRRCS